MCRCTKNVRYPIVATLVAAWLCLANCQTASALLRAGEVTDLTEPDTQAQGTAASSEYVLEIPIAGFTPWVIMAMTNSIYSLIGFEPVRQADIVGNPYPNDTSPHYAAVYLDTGANVVLLSRDDRAGFGVLDIGYSLELDGAGPNPVLADIMEPAGVFCDGMQVLEGGGDIDTSTFVGVSNIAALAARADDIDLPSVMSLPFSVFYTVVIRTDRIYTGTFDGTDYQSPKIEFFTSRYDEGVPAFDHRIHAFFDMPEALPPILIPEDFIILGLYPAPTASAAMFVNVEIDHNGRTIGGTSGGGGFLFDTAAQVTVISIDNALDLNLDLANPEFTVPITGIGGTVDDAPGYTLDMLTIPATGAGDLIFENVPIIVLNIKGSSGAYIDGIVGMNLFIDRNLVIDAGYSGSVEAPSWSGPFVGVTKMRIPGDADLNGSVDLLDYMALERNYGVTDAQWSDGDFNGDGIVNLLDYMVLEIHFMAAVPAEALEISAMTKENEESDQLPPCTTLAVVLMSLTGLAVMLLGKSDN